MRLAAGQTSFLNDNHNLSFHRTLLFGDYHINTLFRFKNVEKNFAINAFYVKSWKMFAVKFCLLQWWYETAQNYELCMMRENLFQRGSDEILRSTVELNERCQAKKTFGRLTYLLDLKHSKPNCHFDRNFYRSGINTINIFCHKNMAIFHTLF